MNEFWSFLLSPAGLALYAAFWAFKLIFGALIVSQIMRLLPDTFQQSIRATLQRWKPDNPFAPALVPAREQRRANTQNLPPALSRTRKQ